LSKTVLIEETINQKENDLNQSNFHMKDLF
jgi:hypothetical protein